jgi:multiple sugar transport system substrate-binding protein
VLLAACGADAGGQAPAQTKASGKVLAAMPAPNPAALELNQPIWDAFHEKLPALSIEVVPVQGDASANYDQKVQILIASDTPPDVFNSGEVRTAEIAANQEGRDLMPLVKRDKVDLNDFYPGLLRGMTYQGKLIALTSNWSTEVMFVNRDLLTRSGVKLPDLTFTMDQFVDAGKKMTRGAGDQAIYGAHNGTWYVPLYDAIWAFGGDMFSPDGKKCLLSSRECVAAIQWIEDLWSRHSVSPGAITQAEEQQLFLAGRLAMVNTAGFWWMTPALRTPNLDWAVTPKPKGPKTRANFLHVGYQALCARAKNLDGGWEWLKFFSSAEGWEARGGPETSVPARKSLADSPRLKKETWMAERGVTQTWKDSAATLHEAPQVLDYFLVQGEIDKALKPIWSGGTSAQAGMDALVPAIDAILARRK